MRASLALLVVLGSSVVAAACGGASADRPLTIPVGLTRDALIPELRGLEYCVGDALAAERATREVFDRCDVTGVEVTQSWVVAHYVDGRVVRLQRFERYPDDVRTKDRFNQLVEKRSQADGPPSAEARARLATRELPAGTRTWVAFRVGETTLAGIYLLDPRPPENATILEEVLQLD